MIYALVGSVMSPINILVLSSGPTFSGLSTFSELVFFGCLLLGFSFDTRNLIAN